MEAEQPSQEHVHTFVDEGTGDRSPQIERLEEAIAVLEAQRAILGDSVANTALATLREKLAALEESVGSPQQQRGLMTVLFADIVHSTQISQGLEPEEALEIMDGALQRLSLPVKEHGGQVTRFMGDGFLAIFGLSVAREDDAMLAVHSALEILEVAHAYGRELVEGHQIHGFDVRVGISTGLVASGGFSEAEDTVMGLTVNLAARLQRAAPPGGVLISHSTYQHVRGAFEVEAQDPIVAKGFADPVPVYLVRQARPRTFRTITRGVPEVETPHVGRDAELQRLQRAFQTAVKRTETHLILIVGEAGIGKSRLLHEFDRWIATDPRRVDLFKGRAGQLMMNTPFSLLRDCFAHGLEILDSDPAAVTRQKLEAGLSAFFEDEPQMKAHFVGALLGYDFANSPHLQGVQDDVKQLRERGLFYLTQFVTALTRRAPVILMLDDLHWADRSSLDAILHLVRECPRLRLVVVCAARAALFQNHSDWDPLPTLDQAKAIRLDLEPLSRQASRQLVGEILHRVDDLPQAFCEQVVSTAEGNPFYVEELVKMLIDDGVIARDEIIDVWHLDRQRIEQLEVPPTLTALLQARLDGLPEGEKQVMRQASVLGRVFWSAALQALQGGNEPPAAELMALSRRQLIDPHERSTFAQTDEYAFRQALMREVTYETVLKRARQAYHRQAAEWLAQITQAGGRSGEYAAVMAEHYRLAGETGAAAEWYVQAGERAQAQASPREARRFLDRALDLLPLSDRELRWRALLARDKALGVLGETEARMADDAALVALAQEMRDDEKLALACLQQGYFVGITGLHDRELEIYKEGLAAAQRAASRQLEASLLSMMVVCKTRLGDLHSAAATAEEALSHAQALGDEQTLVRTLTNTSVFYIESGDIATAAMLLGQQVEINHRLGNREGEAVGLSNLGYNYLQLGLYQLGIDALQRSLELSEDIGHRLFSAYGRLNLGLAYLRIESIQSAQQVLTQGLSELTVINDPFGQAVGQSYLGLVKEQSGEIGEALVLFSSAWAMLSEVGVQGYANDAQAGVARCFLAQGQLGDAQQQATDLSSHLAQNGSKGMEFPILAYQTCADVFEAVGETEYARTMVGAGYRELMARASKISEPHWRKSFLENIPEHRRMMEAWESSPT